MITSQVENGIFVRMAGISWAFGEDQEAHKKATVHEPAPKPKSSKKVAV